MITRTELQELLKQESNINEGEIERLSERIITAVEKPAPRKRNVTDFYKEWDEEAIRSDLAQKAAPAVAICMNLTHDFNKGSVLRALNAFNLQELWLVGRGHWDRRGAVGTQNYSVLKKSATVEPVIADLRAQGYTILAVDNYDGAENVYDVSMPEKTAFVFGEEKRGLSQDVLELCDGLIYIEQYGSVRSLNIAQAAAVIFHEYRRRYRTV